MHWKLVLQLSMFGLAMGIATVFLIPSNVEPICWLAIFAICAFVIAKRSAEKHFLHGFMVSIFNSVWITTAHIVLFNEYVAHHPQEMAMMKSMPLPDSPRLMMALMGPLIGVVSGVVLGVFALIAGKLVNRTPRYQQAGAN